MGITTLKAKDDVKTMVFTSMSHEDDVKTGGLAKHEAQLCYKDSGVQIA